MGGAGGGVVGRACTPRLYCRQDLMRRWLLANELLHKTFQLFELWEGAKSACDIQPRKDDSRQWTTKEKGE